jgi:hypothetical protein
MDDGLIAAHALPLMPFCLPVQSGSDRVLAMNRRHTAAGAICGWWSAAHGAADLALSSDFIVGHPGETDTDQALALVRGQLPRAFSFKYRRDRRPAAAHHRRCRMRQRAATGRSAGAAAGAAAPVQCHLSGGLCLCCSRKQPPSWPGQESPFLQPVHVLGQAGRLQIPVAITPALPNSLWNPHRGRSRLSQTTAIPHFRRPHGKAVTLQFSDNTLPLLLGDHDATWCASAALGVRLSCRGNRVAITGEGIAVDVVRRTGGSGGVSGGAGSVRPGPRGGGDRLRRPS